MQKQRASQDEIGKWVKDLFAAYQRPLNEGALRMYQLALLDLTSRELEISFAEAVKKHEGTFPPPPSEIRKYLEAAREKEPAPESRANSKCRWCLGCGWRKQTLEGETISIEENSYGSSVVRCECAGKAAA